MDSVTPQKEIDPKPRWQPINAIDRRVLGALVEKAKTTPDVYPLSLNALGTACNQKNNRDPVMQLDEAEVEESLVRLRQMGAAGEVQGSGRVSRFRHYLYEWLGVDKVELAVMAELLLRGAQTEGELRSRAARMEPIPDLGDLRPILASLKSKGLVAALTPEGRGHVVTHALYEPREFERLQEHFASSGVPVTHTKSDALSSRTHASQETASLHQGLDEARAEIARLRGDLDDLSNKVVESAEEIRRLKEALGG